MKYTFKIAEIATKPEEALELVEQINNICNSNTKLRKIVYDSVNEYKAFSSISETCLYAMSICNNLNNPNLSIIIEPIL